MIYVRNIRYVRLGTTDLRSATAFASRIIGLHEVGRISDETSGRSIYFRSDRRHHTLVYFDGDPTDQTVAFEVDETPPLKSVARQLTDQGLTVRLGSRDECALRNVNAMLALNDPSGNKIELVIPSRDSDAAFAPPRPAGITGLGHVCLRSTDPQRDEAFWTQLLGAQVSDRIGNAPLLRFDQSHHRLALLPAKHAGIYHIAHHVSSIDDIMRAWYFMQENNVRVVFGPGREPTSNAIFVHFEGPDGMVFAYSTGAKSIASDTNHRPRHFPLAPRSFCMWGGRPDMAQYAE